MYKTTGRPASQTRREKEEKKPLFTGTPEELYLAEFPVLSHDGGPDPLFTYANKKAQELWEMEWDKFIGLPSKYSADADQRETRDQMLLEAHKNGFFTGYNGMRTTSKGDRFFIKNVTIWNLLKNGKKVGQAATFTDWKFL